MRPFIRGQLESTDLLMESTATHARVRAQVFSPMCYRNERISMGLATGREHQRVTVLEEIVAALARPEPRRHPSQRDS